MYIICCLSMAAVSLDDSNLWCWCFDQLLHVYRYTLSPKRCFGAWGGSVKYSQQVKNSQLGELSFFTVQIH